MPPQSGPPPDGDTPFTAEERYRLRLILRSLSDVTPEDIEEIKSLARSGRIARAFGVIMGRIFIWISGAVGLALAWKQFISKGGG